MISDRQQRFANGLGENSKMPPPNSICSLSACELAKLIGTKNLSSLEVATAFLDRIEAINPVVNAVVSLRQREDILRDAAAADVAISRGEHIGALHGLPIAIKDLAQTKDLRTTFGSPIFADFMPAEDQYHVQRIRRAGALIIGKTNVPEFGLGSNTYNSVFGATKNAFNPALTAGGSSGGAAVALALNMLPIADGSDMGGSLRNPAAYNNVYGFRPSQGRIPSGPQIEAFMSQMTVDGPMGRSVADLALLLGVQAGYTAKSPLALDGVDQDYLCDLYANENALHVAWLGDLGGHLPIERGILDLCVQSLNLMRDVGWRIEEVVPNFDFEKLWQAFVTLRHSTIGAGLHVHLEDPRCRDLLKPEARWEAESARGLDAVQIYAASAVRTRWYQTVLELTPKYNLLVLPSAQVFPYDVNTHWPKVVAGRTMDSYHRWMEVTVHATMAGCPAMNVPVGFSADGRPMGMQLIGPPRKDRAVLQAAAVYEEATPWGKTSAIHE